MSPLRAMINADTPRTLEQFITIFNTFVSQQSEVFQQSQQQKSITADTIHFLLEDHGWAGRLPFTRGETYLALKIPKEFLET